MKYRTTIGLATFAIPAILTGCSLFGGGGGTANAAHIDPKKQTQQQQTETKQLKADSKTLHEDIDQLVGWGKVDDLKAGNNWGSFNGTDSPRLTQEVQTFQHDLANAELDKKEQMKQDLYNLIKLVDIAKNHHDKTGGQALIYVHRVCEDLNYYVTGSGEEYGISHTEGAKPADYQPVDDFIQKNSK